MRFFNTAGPVDPDRQYCLDPLSRLDLDEILTLIGQWKYFVLHAPRQTGKTTCLMALVKHLNESGNYRALYANTEVGQSAREDVPDAMRAILRSIARQARNKLQDSFIGDRLSAVLEQSGGHAALGDLLSEWAAASPLPIVLMLDEVDTLVGDTLVSLLRQIRAGYPDRPARFPQSIILCGVRDVRDYRIHSSAEKSIITGGSAFNIKAASLRLGDFSQAEVAQLYAQHTLETGQVFQPEALDLAWELSCGQPWVTNALAYETCFQMDEGKDRSQPITADMMDQAKENLILRRETHLDQLADKLREDRVRRVIEPLLTGDVNPDQLRPDDVQYVRDLGLISANGEVRIANGIYREVIPRELTYDTQVMMHQDPDRYIHPDGRLDMVKLITAFQEFFREHSEHWVGRFDYLEAGPQLLLQAFLQRILNGGGQIHREYGLGRGRTDLLVKWPVGSAATAGPNAVLNVERFVLELKVIGGPRWKGSKDAVVQQGIEQTSGYLDHTGTSEGHLLIFDRDPGKTWEQKIFRREERRSQKSITVWGM